MTFSLSHWDDPVQTMYGRGSDLSHVFAGSRPAIAIIQEIDQIDDNIRRISQVQKTFLEYGGGTGRVAMYLCMFYNVPVVSYDPNASCVAQGIAIKKKLNNEIVDTKMNIVGHVPENQYHYVVSVAVLEHLEGEVFKEAIENIWKCTKPGGLVLLQLRHQADILKLQPFVVGPIAPSGNPKRHFWVAVNKTLAGNMSFLRTAENYY